MITRIEGELIDVHDGRAELRYGAMVYELLIPAIDTQRLSRLIGEAVEFHTLHYLESQGQGSSYLPRLIGFSSAADRRFFELFTSVKGLGNRKALRAFELPVTEIAAAIAAKDTDILKSLPEIGKRTAETIVVELSGKVEQFIEVKSASGTPTTDAQATLIHDAVAVLVQLGENKLTARHLVDRALASDESINTPDQLVATAFRMKE